MNSFVDPPKKTQIINVEINFISIANCFIYLSSAERRENETS